MIMKYLVLALIVAGVWYGFKAISRRNQARMAEDRRQKDSVEEMTACATCGTYVTPEQGNCGKDGCPY